MAATGGTRLFRTARDMQQLLDQTSRELETNMQCFETAKADLEREEAHIAEQTRALKGLEDKTTVVALMIKRLLMEKRDLEQSPQEVLETREVNAAVSAPVDDFVHGQKDSSCFVNSKMDEISSILPPPAARPRPPV